MTENRDTPQTLAQHFKSRMTQDPDFTLEPEREDDPPPDTCSRCDGSGWDDEINVQCDNCTGSGIEGL